jgi:hypothetical protein
MTPSDQSQDAFAGDALDEVMEIEEKRTALGVFPGFFIQLRN